MRDRGEWIAREDMKEKGEENARVPFPNYISHSPQNENFNPNWISRGLFATALTTPKLLAPKVVPGAANCERLNKLKNSVRNSRFVLSVKFVRLKMAKSKLIMPS